MKLLGPKRCKAARGTLYTVTALALSFMCVSFWFPQTLVVQHTSTIGEQRLIIFELAGARLSGEQSPMIPPVPSKRIEIQRIGASILSLGERWWAPPHFARFPTTTPNTTSITPFRFSIPLFYPSCALLLCSFWLLKKQLKKFGPEQCTGCGYDLQGLNEHTCPECGITNAQHHHPD
jgi:hypothetical protein